MSRTIAARLGKMPTTSERRRSSRFKRSCGLVDHSCRQWSRGKLVKARSSSRASSSSPAATAKPEISRRPSRFTPMARSAAAETMRPPSRTRSASRIQRQHAVRCAIERSAAEGLDLAVEGLRELADLRLGDATNAQRLDQVLDAARADAEHIGLGHDGDECALGAPARLEQPRRKVRARTKLRDPEVDRAEARVEAPLAIAITSIHSLRAALAEAGASEGVDLAAHELLDHAVQEIAQKVRIGLLQLFANERDGVHRWVRHRRRPPL